MKSVGVVDETDILMDALNEAWREYQKLLCATLLMQVVGGSPSGRKAFLSPEAPSVSKWGRFFFLSSSKKTLAGFREKSNGVELRKAVVFRECKFQSKTGKLHGQYSDSNIMEMFSLSNQVPVWYDVLGESII